MNLQEYKESLRKLSSEEFIKFNVDFGGGELSIEERIRDFVDHPQHERRICQLLDLKTEAQKITEATVNSADAAVKSASSAKISMVCSIFACLAAVVAAIVAVLSIVKS